MAGQRVCNKPFFQIYLLIERNVSLVKLKGKNSHIFSVNVNRSMLVHSPPCKVNSYDSEFHSHPPSSSFPLPDTSSAKIVLYSIIFTSQYLFNNPHLIFLLLEIHRIRHINPSRFTFCNSNFTTIRRTRP